MNMIRLVALLAAASAQLVGNATFAQATAATPSPPASANAVKVPPKACLDVLDRLSLGIPRDETGPVLRSKGLRIRTPIQVPEGVITDSEVISAVRVRLMIDASGRVVPRSVQVQASEGDPALARAIPDSLRFH